MATTTTSGVVLAVDASMPTAVGGVVFANVSISGGSSPTGDVSFALYGVNDPTCSAAPVFTSAVPISESSATSNQWFTTQPGTYHWEASYDGDANNSPTPPTSCSANLSSVIVSLANPSLNVTANPASGTTISASAMIHGYNPTGTITFYLTPPGNSFCSGTPVFTSTVTVQGNGAFTSAPYTFPVGGLYKWQATYSGDANNIKQSITQCIGSANNITVPLFATFIYPINGATGVSSTHAFTWNGVSTGTGYFLMVGTTIGGWDLAWSGDLPASQTSYTVGGLPAGTLYATLYTAIGGIWTTLQQITFTATPTSAGFISPSSGEANVSTRAPFTWTTVTGVQGYFLWISDTYGGGDILSSPLIPPTQSSYTPPVLPANTTLYAILFTERNNVLSYQAVTFYTGQ